MSDKNLSQNLLKNISRRQFVAASGAVAATAALAACDNSSGVVEGPDGTASSNDDVDAADKTKISFVLDYTPNTNHTGIYVALANGYFAAEGLEVEIVQPPADGADALIGAGGAQMGVSYQDYIANNLASDQPMPYSAVASSSTTPPAS